MFRIFREPFRGVAATSRLWHRLRWLAVILVLFVVLAVGGAACYIVSDLTHPGEQTAKLMLPDTDGYATFNLKPGLAQSLEFKRFLDSFLEDRWLDDSLQGLLDEFESYWGIDVAMEIQPWLGPELAVGAVFNPDLTASAIFLVGTADESATDALLQKWLAKRVEGGEPITIRIETYRGVEVTVVSNASSDQEFYAVTYGYGMAAFAPTDFARICQTIDLMKDGGASLWDNADFQQARSNLPAERMGMGWVDVAHLLGLFGDSLEEPADIALFNALSPYGSSFASFSLTFANKGLKLHVYSPTAEGWDFAIDEPNALNVTSLVPHDALGCYADHNMPLWWQETMEKREELAQNEEWNEILEQSFNVTAVEDRYGFDFEEDVFGWMTGEYAFAAQPHWGNLFGARPDALALFQFGNQTQVEGSLDTIISGINNSGDATLEVSYTTIAGVNATLVDCTVPAFGEPFTVGYLFLDDFLVIGTSEDALADVVQVHQHPELSLAQSPKYQRMSALLPGSKTGLFYADPPRIVNFILSIPDASPYGTQWYFEYYAPFVEPLQDVAFSYFVGADDTNLSLELHVERVLTSHHPYPNPDSDEQVAVQAQIFGNTTVQQAELVWSANDIPQSDLDMYDDGAHGDEAAADGIYGVQIGPFPADTIVEYQVRVTDVDGDVIVAPNYPASFQSLEPLAATSDILLVVDDTDPYIVEYLAPYFTASLDALSLSYDFWDASLRGVPEQDELTGYLDGVVIWGEGAYYMQEGYLAHHLTKEDALAALASYLDAGGALLLCGNNVATALESEAFLSDYVHATYVQDYVRLYAVLGVPGDPISDGLDLPVYAWSADEVDPFPPAVTIFTYDPSATHLMASTDAPELSSDIPEQAEEGALDGNKSEGVAGQKLAVNGIASSGTAALRVDTGAYKLVFLAFGFEEIVSAGDRHITMERALTWLAPNVTEHAAPLLLSPADSSTVEVGDVTFEWWEKATATGYHIQIDAVDTFDSPDLIEADPVVPEYSQSLGVGSYYWRVKAHLNGEDTGYSPTWRLTIAEPVVQVTTHPGADRDPAITQTADGKVWVVYERYGEIWYNTSADGGSTWSGADELVAEIYEAQNPAIAQMDSGTVWVLWCSDASGNADIWYRTSSDGGTTWLVASQITTHPDEDECPAIVEMDDGTMWAVWESYRSGNPDIWYKTSSDGGTTWSEATQLTDHGAGDLRPAIAQTDDGAIWVVWQRCGGIYRRTSTDGGETWTAASYIAAGGSPAIAQTPDGTLWLGLERNDNIWYMSSQDDGDTWTGQTQFTRFVCEDERPGVAPLSTGQLALAWASDRSGNDDIWYGVIGYREDVNPPPCCEWVGHEPPNPDTLHTVAVRAEAVDESGVQSVELVWWVDDVPQPNRLLYDDGSHSDYQSGDHVYGIELGPFPIPGTFVEYQVRVTDVDGNSILCPQYRRYFEVLEPFIRTEDILVVEDGASWLVDYFTDTLDSLGYGYDYWDDDLRGRIHGGVLSLYTDAVVVWASPYCCGYICDEETQEELAWYLDNGGSLFVSGQQVDSCTRGSWFLEDYLHAEFVQYDVDLYGLFGVPADPISDGLYVSISGGDGADNQYSPSEIDPIVPAAPIFTYDTSPTPTPTPPPPTPTPSPTPLSMTTATTHLAEPFAPGEEGVRGGSDEELPQLVPVARIGEEIPTQGSSEEREAGTMDIQSSGSGALRVDTGTYKVVYFAFGFEAINSAVDRQVVMERVIDWLSETHWSMPMTAETDTEGANPYLEFGASSGATDGYDSGIDVPHTPPAPDATFDARFEIDGPPFSQLDKDYRGAADCIQWTLHVEADIDDIMLTWDASGVPSYLCVYMDLGTGVIDMKAQSSITLSAGQYSISILAVRETDIALVAGWNMVSVPVIPPDPSVDSVFPGAELVCGWDRENQVYIYSPAEVEPDQGYWVAMLEDAVVTVCGMPVYEWTGNMTAGWNMIGSVAGDVQVTDWYDDPGGNIEPYAWWWNPTARAYDFFVLPATIEATKAYWIAATGNCTLTLP